MTDKYDEVAMKTAVLWSELSTCKRKKVCAVVVKNNRILTHGVNGTKPGECNSCEETCPKCLGVFTKDSVCKVCDGMGIVTKADTVHAEINAINNTLYNREELKDSTMYLTLSPCINCAKVIVKEKIKRVVYLTEYSDSEGIEYLKSNNVDIIKFKGK